MDGTTFDAKIQGAVIAGGRVAPLKRVNPNLIERKKYIYKIYDNDGKLLETLDDVINEPTWSQEKNSTGSSITIELARNSKFFSTKYGTLADEDSDNILDEEGYSFTTTGETFDKVGKNSAILTNNRLDVIVFYGETEPLLDSSSLPILDSNSVALLGTLQSPNGSRIFSGFIEEIEQGYGDDEITTLQVTSYGFDLDQYVLTSGAGKTTVTYNSQDPSDIMKAVLDLFNTQGGDDVFINYSADSIEDTGTVVSYTFQANTYMEAVKKIVELCPANWYFYIGLGDNTLYLKNRSTTPHHIFYLGKHIKSLKLREYIGDIVNDVYFVGGGTPPLYKRYTETPAIYTRRGLKIVNDSRVTVAASAKIISDTEIANKKNKAYRSTLEIIEKVYDIESINVGDIVGFRNFNNEIDELTMQVVGLTYTPDVVTLQLDTLIDTTNKRLEDIKRNLDVQSRQDIGDAPA